MKTIFAIATGMLLAIAGGLPAHAADDYPSRPIRIVVPYASGGGSSLSALLAAEALEKVLGQRVLIENRPGATGMVGIDYATKQPPDGYTLLWDTTDLPTLAAIKPNLPYKLPDNFSFIGRVAENGLVVTVTSQLPIHSMADLISYGKAHPGKLLFGTSGVGSTPHLAGLLLDKYTGMQMTAVPYKGVAESITDLVSGRIQLGLLTPVSIASYIGSDKIRFIGIMAPTRATLFPDVKTMAELGLQDVKAAVWYGLFGPPNIPEPIMQRLEAAIATIAKDPAVQKKFSANGLQMDPILGDDFKKATMDEYQQWKDIAQSNHIVITD